MQKEIIEQLYTPEVHEKFTKASYGFKDKDKLIEFIREQKLAQEIVKTVMEAVHSKTIQYDFQGHKHTFQRLIETIAGGKHLQDVLAEEAEKFKYEYQRKFASLIEDFARRFEVEAAFFLFNEEYEERYKTIDGFAQNKKMLNYITIKCFLDEQKCDMCGTRLLRLNGVNPSKTALHEQCNMNIDTIQEVIVDFPSGVIFAKDWFRDDLNALSLETEIEKSKICETLLAQGADTYGICYGDSALNNYAEVNAYAEKDVVSIFVGNSSPDLFKDKGNKISAVCWDEEDTEHKKHLQEKGMKMEGSVCTDLWRVTLVDEAILDKIFKDYYKQEEIPILKNEWEKHAGVVKIKVKPGKYKVKYHLQRGFISKEKVGESNLNTYFSIEPVEA